MTPTLILTRHAKSSWSSPSLDDHSRPLNERGRKSAKAIGAWLAARGLVPDQVLCSSAQRTRETWERMGLPTTDVVYTDLLYHASATQMLRALGEAEGPTVMMLGHNPGIGEFAEMLVNAPHPHPRFHDYPTCATAIIDFDIDDWARVAWRGGTVRDFIIPRELTE